MTKQDFFKCGIAGWCLEVIWTGGISCLHHDLSMTASTSLLMFPIYGMGAFIKPISHFLAGNPIYSMHFCGRIYNRKSFADFWNVSLEL